MCVCCERKEPTLRHENKNVRDKEKGGGKDDHTQKKKKCTHCNDARAGIGGRNNAKEREKETDTRKQNSNVILLSVYRLSSGPLE